MTREYYFNPHFVFMCMHDCGFVLFIFYCTISGVKKLTFTLAIQFLRESSQIVVLHWLTISLLSIANKALPVFKLNQENKKTRNDKRTARDRLPALKALGLPLSLFHFEKPIRLHVKGGQCKHEGERESAKLA